MPVLTERQGLRLIGVMDWLGLGLARCFAINHSMFHGTFCENFDGEPTKEAFAFVVIGTETAKRAQELLAQLPLCTTDLGDVPPRSYPADSPQPSLTAELLVQALDEVGGDTGYGGPGHYVIRLLADKIRERTGLRLPEFP